MGSFNISLFLLISTVDEEKGHGKNAFVFGKGGAGGAEDQEATLRTRGE